MEKPMPKMSKAADGRAMGLRGSRLKAYSVGHLGIKKKPKAKKRKSK